jgi:hypothetical protein
VLKRTTGDIAPTLENELKFWWVETSRTQLGIRLGVQWHESRVMKDKVGFANKVIVGKVG